jgi:2-oxoisovalerate dehydrogenase E1 component beta subunit
MREDPRVVVLGEDVGRFGGVFRATLGLRDEFGDERVMDTPLSESGIVGSAIGMAVYGLRPVAEIQFADFVWPAFDQFVSELSKLRYRSGGEFTAPLVVRMPYGGGIKGGLYHSQSPEAYFAHTAGLKVVVPSNPYDAKGLLLSAIADEDPIVFLEPKRVYRAATGDVPPERYEIPIGQAKVVRTGRDVTVLTYGAMVHVALEAATQAAADPEHPIDMEVVDLRTLVPLDLDTVLTSVQRTGRACIVHEAPRTCGYGAELAALLCERALLSLEAPIERVTGFDTPFPCALEHEYLPTAQRVVQAARRTLAF